MKIKIKGYSHREVAHMFAHQSQNIAIGSNMFYEPNNGGSTLFSYGYHFPIAHMLNNGTLIVNDSGYSVSTSQHQSVFHSATSHRNKIYVKEMIYQDDLNRKIDDIFYKHQKNIDHYYNPIIFLLKKYERARTQKDYYSRSILSNVATIKDYIEYFQIPKRLLSSKIKRLIKLDVNFEDISNFFNVQVKKDTIAEQKAKKAAIKKALNDYKWDLKLHYESIKEWKALERDNILSVNHYSSFVPQKEIVETYDYLRLKEYEGQMIVQTSQDVKLSLINAKRAIKQIKRLLNIMSKQNLEYLDKYLIREFTDKTVEIVGLIGKFKLDYIDKHYIKSGCHKIQINEILDIEKEVDKHLETT